VLLVKINVLISVTPCTYVLHFFEVNKLVYQIPTYDLFLSEMLIKMKQILYKKTSLRVRSGSSYEK
jgi:hypothetical protein